MPLQWCDQIVDAFHWQRYSIHTGKTRKVEIWLWKNSSVRFYKQKMRGLCRSSVVVCFAHWRKNISWERVFSIFVSYRAFVLRQTREATSSNRSFFFSVAHKWRQENLTPEMGCLSESHRHMKQRRPWALQRDTQRLISQFDGLSCSKC